MPRRAVDFPRTGDVPTGSGPGPDRLIALIGCISRALRVNRASMDRQAERDAIERWIAKHSVTRLPPAYAAPIDGAPPAAEQHRRVAKMQIEVGADGWLRVFYAGLQHDRRSRDAAALRRPPDAMKLRTGSPPPSATASARPRPPQRVLSAVGSGVEIILKLQAQRRRRWSPRPFSAAPIPSFIRTWPISA